MLYGLTVNKICFSNCLQWAEAQGQCGLEVTAVAFSTDVSILWRISPKKKKCVCICGRVSMYARQTAKHHRIMQEVKTAAEYRSGIFIKCLITDGTVLKCEHLNSSCHNSNSYSRNTGPFCTDMKDTHFWRILLKKKKKTVMWPVKSSLLSHL